MGAYDSATGTGSGAWAIGYACNAFGDRAIALGNNSTATGNFSTAIGWSNLASGLYSLATGQSTQATGSAATATGSGTIAGGSYSTAMGYNTTASATGATAIGWGNLASGSYSTALGYNTTAGHTYSVAMGRDISTTAFSQFVARFSGGYILQSNSTGSAGVKLTSGAGSWSSISDRRAKNTITDLGYGLHEVLSLKPSQYYYNGSKQLSLGFVAQEINEVIPEVVNTPANSEEMMSVRYTELIPILTKAIQEQQEIIDALNERIIALEQK